MIALASCKRSKKESDKNAVYIIVIFVNAII